MRKLKKLLLPLLIAMIAALGIGFIACSEEEQGPEASPYTLTITSTGNKTTVMAGDTLTLRSSVTGTTQKDVTWSSSDPAVATVSDRGVVTGVAQGEVTVTAKLVIDERCFNTIKITVEKPLAPNALSVTGYGADRIGWTGETLQLAVAVEPAASSKLVDWTSSDPAVASVDENGTVTFLAKGAATVTATSKVDATKTDSVTFTVRKGTFKTTVQGLSDASLATVGWDFSHQDDDGEPYIDINSDDSKALKDMLENHTSAWFVGTPSTKFYAKATFNCYGLGPNPTTWQLFGIGSGRSIGDCRYFGYSPFCPGQDNMFNKMLVQDLPVSWGPLTGRSQMWGDRILGSVSGDSDTIKPESSFKIEIVRDGNNYYYFLNDTLMYFDVNPNFDGVGTLPFVMTYRLPVKVTDYAFTTDETEIAEVLAKEESRKQMYTSNSKVVMDSEDAFTFNSKTFSKDNMARSIGDKTMVLRNFDVEFKVKEIDIGSSSKFAGVTLNFSRYDTADTVDMIGIGKSTEQAGAPVVGRFSQWAWPDSYQGSAYPTWYESLTPALSDLAAEHTVRVTRRVDEDAQKAYFHLYIDGTEVPLTLGRANVNVKENTEYDGAVTNYVGSYVIWFAGEYTSFKVTNIDINSNVEATSLKEEVAIGNTSFEAEVGDVVTVEATLASSGEGSYTYTSSNTSVATVSADGKLTALAPGKTVVTVKNSDGAATARTFTVKPLASITITNAETELWAGQTLKITYSVEPESAHEFGFSVDNAAVATISEEGVLSPVSDGTVTVTVFDKLNPAVSATKTITVTTSLRLAITNEYTYVEIGDTLQLEHIWSYTPDNTAVTYTSNSTDVATISDTGLITGVTAGDVTIEIQSVQDTSVIATKTFHIVAPLSITISNKTQKAYVGYGMKLAYEYSYPAPEDAPRTAVFTVVDNEYAQITSAGAVTPLKKGTVTVTVTDSAADTVTDSFELAIVNPVLDKDTISYHGDNTVAESWNFDNLGKEDATVTVTHRGYTGSTDIAFSDVEGKMYYAEATFKDVVNNGWDWNMISVGNKNLNAAEGAITFRGFSISQEVKKSIFVEYIDYWHNDDGYQWDGYSKATQLWNCDDILAIDFSNVKLATLRNGNKFYHFVNDVLYWYDEASNALTNVDTAPAISVHYAAATISNMSAKTLADQTEVDALLATKKLKKFVTLSKNRVAIDEEAGTIEFKGANINNGYDAIQQNCAMPIGDTLMLEAGKDARVEFKYTVKEYLDTTNKVLDGNQQNALVAIFLRQSNNVNAMRSFVLTETHFGVNGWNWSNMNNAIADCKTEIVGGAAVNTEHTVVLERKQGEGFKMTVDGAASCTWNYDDYNSAHTIGFGAAFCNAVISNISITYPV